MSVDLAISSLVCRHALTDLLKTNPFLDEEVVEELTQLMVLTLLHSVRVGQSNRVLSECRKLRSMLQREVSESGRSDHRLQITQRIEGLAKQLTARRHYIDADGGFDPRCVRAQARSCRT